MDRRSGCCIRGVSLLVTGGIIEYFRDRGEDLLDVLRLRFIVPDRAEGYGLKVRATCLAQVGYVT